MSTYIAYFDESGDDGPTCASSEAFVLTSMYMKTEDWQENYDNFKKFRQSLKEKFGFHVSQEMHTAQFLRDKDPYRTYGWSTEQRREILILFTKCIASLKIKIVNVIIDKTKFYDNNYQVLDNALTYNIQRIENDCKSKDNENDCKSKGQYIIITDKGRLAPMRYTARKIRAFNPTPSNFGGYYDNPIKCLIEDILEKDSEESYFIQICDFVSQFVYLYFHTNEKKQPLPNRVANVIEKDFCARVLATLKKHEVLNLSASKDKYGLVVYPR